MSKRTVSHRSITPTATGDTANLVNSTFPFALQGANGTQASTVQEVFCGGQAGASAPTFMVLGRDSTVGLTLSADATLNDAADSGASASGGLANAPFNKTSTPPQRSSTLGCLVNLSFNAFGGIVRWVAPDVYSFVSIVGNTASLGEVSLSAFTGGTTGLLGAHMVYETL